ncbi:20908_t:CDS:1, partial [Gigaspora margarita]
MNCFDKIKGVSSSEVKEPRVANKWTIKECINDDNKIMIFDPRKM